jgi:hypothetical protein
MRDEEVMYGALSNERQQLHERILQLDRIMKRIKDGEYSPAVNVIAIDAANTPALPVVSDNAPIFPKHADIKVQIIRVFDLLGKASKLQVIQDEYDRLNDNAYPLRDKIRAMQRTKYLVLIKVKNSTRGFLWARSTWIENGKLLEQYKPEGFDLLYRPETLVFE